MAFSPETVKAKADAIKKILTAHAGNKSFYINVGGKKIKTSYKVSGSEELREELFKLISS